MLRAIFVLAILIPGIATVFANRYAVLALNVWFALLRRPAMSLIPSWS